MSVKVSNLTKIYGQQKAVNNLSFEIASGEVVGFLGPNGAGKSTTMKMLTGFIEPTSGSASICGQNIVDHPMGVRKKVGYLPESNPLYYDMYVKEYLNFVAGAYQIKKKNARISEMIGITGLEREQHKKISQLSKGYKQRVGIAQAMIHDPEVLILDEPTSGLDPNQLVDVRKLITDLGKEKTVMLSTHVMQEVEAMCGRVLIINQGNIVANDTVGHIQSSKDRVKRVQFLTEKPMQSFGKVTITKLDNHKFLATSKTKEDLRALIFNQCVATNNVLLHLEEERTNLEDVFKKVTK